MFPVRRVALCVAVLISAIALQLVVFSRLPLPGVAPNLVLVAVVALAMTYGSLTGGVCGFVAGLALDVAPPADHVVGRTALVLCLVGYAAGAWWRRTPTAARSTRLALVVVAVAALGSCALTLAIASLLGEAPVGSGLPELAWTVTSDGLYAAVLALGVMPVMLARARRRDSDAYYLARLR
jgi:rod shape-determining protein MreD